MKKEISFLDLAVAEARAGLRANHGGPFGAIVVCKGKVVAIAHNEVIKTSDPTAHAELLAVRRAAKKLKRFDLSDCELYSTCEPCPMCLGAIYWARIKKVFFGCSKEDAARIGFDDSKIFDFVFSKKKSALKQKRLLEKDCLAVFAEWKKKPDKIPY